MATDTAAPVESTTVEVTDEAYVTPLADFLLIATSMSLLALLAAGVIVL